MARENTIEGHNKAAEAMTRRYPAREVPFKLGDRVLLEAKNLKLKYPFRKLAPKREGPFKIVEQLGPVTFRLNLPKQWKIHPVFHAGLLTPYRETKEHGPNHTEPPPELIEGHEELEVEAILNHRTRGRVRKTRQFLIAWKGYPSAENTWEPESHLKNAPVTLQAYKKKHRLK